MVRTLDAIHLATIDHLQHVRRETVSLASYDRRLNEAAKLMGFALCEL